jgi:proteasome accessory factor C
MSAPERFARIVSLVATLTRRGDDEPDESVAITELATQHGVSPQDIAADIRALTVLGEDADTDWLLSLQVWQQGERVAVSSRGPFRRPVRLSPEEQLAVQVALAMDGEGEALAKRLAALWTGETTPATKEPDRPETPAEIIRDAIHERQALEVDYAGETDAAVRTRLIHPYQMAEVGVRTYIVAYASDVNAWRHFRLDRIVAVRPANTRFEARYDFEPIETGHDVFRARGQVERVTVRFQAAAAPWATEYFSEHELLDDGSVNVPFPASSKEWLTRRVLEFGTDAVVMEPPAYRDALRRAVA